VGPDGRLTTIDSTRRWRSLRRLWRQAPKRDLLRFAWLCARVAARKEDGYLGGPYFDGLGRRRDDRPISAYFSAAFCQAVIRPIVVRMNGAEPDEVFLGNFGSNLRALLDTYDQPKDGMRPLLERFAARVPVRLLHAGAGARRRGRAGARRRDRARRPARGAALRGRRDRRARACGRAAARSGATGDGARAARDPVLPVT
jgi:oxygen-dependent protoporphyrinogen oxidase